MTPTSSMFCMGWRTVAGSCAVLATSSMFCMGWRTAAGSCAVLADGCALSAGYVVQQNCAIVCVVSAAWMLMWVNRCVDAGVRRAAPIAHAPASPMLPVVDVCAVINVEGLQD
jgi:hypothetical protein